MKQNTDIFNEFDMVVSVTQGAINDQLTHLLSLGTIKSNLILTRDTDADGNYVYTVLDSTDDIPVNDDGIPIVEFMDAQINPQILIESSGPYITFVMKFPAGTLNLWKVVGGVAQLASYDMAGWQYGVVMNMGLETVADDYQDSDSIPDNVKDQLTDFSDNMFSINYLFMDFESTDLVTYNPTQTSVEDSGDSTRDQLVLFMQGYLGSLDAENNPYILGYSLETTDDTTYPDDADVPDSMQPTGTSYTMYYDASNPDLSTLNYCLVTKGGFNTINNDPDSFPDNWISPDDQCDGKMIYSHTVLIEEIFLKPLFDSMYNDVYKEIKDDVNVDKGNDYDAAKKTGSDVNVSDYSDMKTTPTIEYQISNDDSGNNEYINRFAVAMSGDNTSVTLEISGYCYVYKKNSQDELTCTAKAWAHSSITWGGNIIVEVQKDEDGNPILVTSNNLATLSTSSGSDQNSCATTYGIIGDILGSFLDLVTLGFDDMFTDLFDDLFTIKIPSITDLSSTFDYLPNAVQSTIMLPAGDTFFFKNPGIDDQANFDMSLTYKSATSAMVEDSTEPSSMQSASKCGPSQSQAATSTEDSTESSAQEDASQLLPGGLSTKQRKHPKFTPEATSFTETSSSFDESAQYTDILTLADLQDTSGQLTVNVSCELMTNQQQSSPVEPNENLLAVQDSNGEPLLFSIGTDNILRMIRRSNGSATGWETVDLSSSFTDYDTAVTFDVTQDADGHLAFVIALANDGTDGTHVAVASMLSNDAQNDLWSDFASVCTTMAGIDDNFAVENILQGVSDDGSSPLVILVGTSNNATTYYQSLDGTSATHLEFPENVSDDLDAVQALSIGYAFGQRGVWFLYTVGDAQTLECTTIANAQLGALSYDYSPTIAEIPDAMQGLTYTCIATPTGDNTQPLMISSDIYIGTSSGVYLMPGASAQAMVQITDAVEDVHEIIVRDDGTNLSIWVMCSPNTIYYIAGQRSDTNGYAFSAPTLFDTSSIHIAPIRNANQTSNELFLVGQDLSVVHHWQDPESTLWNEATIKTQDDNYVIDVNTYTTQVRLLDSTGNTITGQTLRITSSQWVYATINGLVYSLDLDNPASIPTDACGNVTIVLMTEDASSPVFHVESDRFQETLNIYPTAKVQAGLSTIESGDDLSNATTQSGDPVVDSSSYDDATLDGVASNLSTLISSADGMTEGEKADGNLFVSVSTNQTKETGALNTEVLPDGFAVGMRVTNGSWASHSNTIRPRSTRRKASLNTFSSNTSSLSTMDVWSSLTTTAGDAWKSLENLGSEIISGVVDGVTYLEDGVSFVIQKVESGLEFVLQLADDYIQIALETLADLYKALSWILNLIEIGLLELLSWLGFLFGWDDIWDTHKVIAKMLNNGLSYCIDRADVELEQWKSSVDSFLEGLKTQIADAQLPSDTANSNPQSDGVHQRNTNPFSDLSSPPSNWLIHQIQNNGFLSGGSTEYDSTIFDDFYDTVIVPTITNLSNNLNDVLDDIIHIATSNTATYNDALQLVKDLAETFIDGIKDLADGILDFVPELLAFVQSNVGKTVNIPFVSEFYTWLTTLMGSSEKLTFVNGTSLLVAIVHTTVYKAAEGKAPFSNGSHGMDDSDLLYQLAPFDGMNSTTSLAFAPSANAQDSGLAKNYSTYGGSIAAIGGFVGAIVNLCAAALDENSKAAKDMTLITACCSLLVHSGSFPVTKSGQSDAAHALKIVVWAITLLSSLAGLALPSKTPDSIRYGSQAVVDLIALILLLIADAMEDEDALTWLGDILSGLGGITFGTATAFKQTEVAVAGTGVVWFGSIVALVEALTKDIAQIPNTGT